MSAEWLYEDGPSGQTLTELASRLRWEADTDDELPERERGFSPAFRLHMRAVAAECDALCERVQDIALVLSGDSTEDTILAKETDRG